MTAFYWNVQIGTFMTANANKKKKSNLERFKAKKPYTKPVRMCMDSSLTEARELAEADLDKKERAARITRNLPESDERRIEAHSDAADAEALLADLDEQIDDATVEFVFRSIPRKKYLDLQHEHRPSEEERETFAKEAKEAGKPLAEQKGPRVSNLTYPPALITLSMIDPKLSAEEVAEMFDGDDWNNAELQTLVLGAETACNSISLPR